MLSLSEGGICLLMHDITCYEYQQEVEQCPWTEITF